MANYDQQIPRGPRRESQPVPRHGQPQGGQPQVPQGGYNPQDANTSQGGHAAQNGRAQHVAHTQHSGSASSQHYVPQNNASGMGARGQHAGAGVGVGASGSDAVYRVRKKRKKTSTAKRVVLIVVLALLLIVGGLGAFAFWYTNSIANNMAMNSSEKSAVDKVLTTTENTEQPFYALVVGSDKWQQNGERSDAMILVRVDPNVPQVTMVSIPRDTPYMYNGQKVKINHAYEVDGAAGAIKAVQELTGVPISYYAEIEFDGLKNYVDYLGGIMVNVPQTIDYKVYTGDQPTIHIQAGEQTLNGTQAVALARMRTAYEGNQDEMRQENVRAMAVALLKTTLSGTPAEVLSNVQQLSACMKTNMPMDKMVDFARKFAGKDVTIYTATGPAAGAIDESAGGQWLCYEDPQGWADLMAKVNAGKDPKAS